MISFAIIQVLFGWTNSHLHSFSPVNDPSTEYGMVMPDFDMGDNMLNESENFVYPDLEKGNVIYTYDFGASWTHQIELEKMITMKAFIQAGHHQLPVVVAGRGQNESKQRGIVAERLTHEILMAYLRNLRVAGMKLIRINTFAAECRRVFL